MKKLIWVSTLVGFMVILPGTAALAVSVGLTPSSATVMSGDTISVAVVISGLVAAGPPSVGAFDLTIAFDATRLSFSAVSFGHELGEPAFFEALTDFKVSAFGFIGLLELAEVSLLSPTDLDLLQPAAFRLATVSFKALTSGATSLGFFAITVEDAFGNSLALALPEPSTLLLLGSGLAGLAVAAWRRRPS